MFIFVSFNFQLFIQRIKFLLELGQVLVVEPVEVMHTALLRKIVAIAIYTLQQAASVSDISIRYVRLFELMCPALRGRNIVNDTF